MEDKLHCKNDRVTEIMKHPETQLLIYVLLIMKLIDDGDLKNVSANITLNSMIRQKNLATSSWPDAEV